MKSSDTETRHYRFGPRDRASWLLGLQASQCVGLGVGILAAGVLLNVGVVLPVVIVPLIASALFAFARRNGRPVHEQTPVLLGWSAARAAGATTWQAPPPRFGRPRSMSLCEQPELPAPLAGLSILESTHAPWTRRGRDRGAAVIRDSRDHTISAVVRVHGRDFSLSERAEQERLLHMWGDALAAFCVERGPVCRVRWIEWAAPAGLDEQLAYLAEHRDPLAAAAPVAAYRDVLERAGPMATRHETLVVVTVDERRVRLRRGARVEREAAAEETLMDELRLLSTRLESAGLTVDDPLSTGEIALAWRERLDPFGAPGGRAGRRSLLELAGLVSVRNSGPLSMDAAPEHVRVDGAVHAVYVIAEWPRLEVPPAWMEPLLLYAGGIRTIAVHYEPVAPSRAQRNVAKQTVKLSSDEEQRSRSGFRIGARHRRAQADVLDREAELVAGYAEFEFVGFVAVTARDLDALERSCAEYEQVAAQTGLELRRLDGRHDLALACALPVGRGVTPKRFA